MNENKVIRIKRKEKKEQQHQQQNFGIKIVYIASHKPSLNNFVQATSTLNKTNLLFCMYNNTLL